MRIIFLLVTICILATSFGQPIASKSSLPKQEYLAKSKRQKTIALVTTGVAALSLAVGGIVYMSEFGNGSPGGTGYNEATSNTGETLMYIGIGVAVITIPIAIASARNAKIAASLSIKNGALPNFKNKVVAGGFHPSLSLCIGLK